jgi:hypothetical protein
MQIHLSNTKSWVLRLLPYAFILILVSLLYKKCESEKLQIANVSALNAESKVYKLKNGQLAMSKVTLQYTNKQLKEEVIEKDAVVKEMASKFSKVKTVIKIVTETKIDTILLPYKDSIPYVFNKKGRLENKDYIIAYNSNQKGISIDFLSVPDTTTIVTGIKRKWFFGKKTETIDITHSNKLINNGKVDHFEVVQNKNFFQTTFFKVGAGIIFGAIIIR